MAKTSLQPTVLRYYAFELTEGQLKLLRAYAKKKKITEAEAGAEFIKLLRLEKDFNSLIDI